MDVMEQALARRRLRGMIANGQVRTIRAAYGVTQEHMAEELGVGRDTMSEWESGKREPRAITDVVRWLQVLDELAQLANDDDQEDVLATAGT